MTRSWKVRMSLNMSLFAVPLLQIAFVFFWARGGARRKEGEDERSLRIMMMSTRPVAPEVQVALGQLQRDVAEAIALAELVRTSLNAERERLDDVSVAKRPRQEIEPKQHFLGGLVGSLSETVSMRAAGDLLSRLSPVPIPSSSPAGRLWIADEVREIAAIERERKDSQAGAGARLRRPEPETRRERGRKSAAEECGQARDRLQQQLRREEYIRERLMFFYQQLNPTKLNDIDRVLAGFAAAGAAAHAKVNTNMHCASATDEAALNTSLRKVYGLDLASSRRDIEKEGARLRSASLEVNADTQKTQPHAGEADAKTLAAHHTHRAVQRLGEEQGAGAGTGSAALAARPAAGASGDADIDVCVQAVVESGVSAACEAKMLPLLIKGCSDVQVSRHFSMLEFEVTPEQVACCRGLHAAAIAAAEEARGRSVRSSRASVAAAAAAARQKLAAVKEAELSPRRSSCHPTGDQDAHGRVARQGQGGGHGEQVGAEQTHVSSKPGMTRVKKTLVFVSDKNTPPRPLPPVQSDRHQNSAVSVSVSRPASEAGARQAVEARAATAAEQQAAGVGLYVHDKTFVVRQLAEGGAAQECGRIQPGDKLVAIDGQATFTRNISQVKHMLSGPPGSRVVLHFRRDGAWPPRGAGAERHASGLTPRGLTPRGTVQDVVTDRDSAAKEVIDPESKTVFIGKEVRFDVEVQEQELSVQGSRAQACTLAFKIELERKAVEPKALDPKPAPKNALNSQP